MIRFFVRGGLQLGPDPTIMNKKRDRFLIVRRITEMGKYKTVYQGNTAEIVEKKSRFIANLRLVETEEEALAFIEQMKKKYWDARHNCYAYVLGERREILRCSDDGEPQGTAGRPMLDVLLGADLYQTVVVVTRYFGGTLLGTGGLVRAYSQAVQQGIAESILIERKQGARLDLHTDYSGIGKIQYLLGEQKIPQVDSEYTDQVRLTVILPAGEEDRMKKELTEATSGRVRFGKEEPLQYALLDGQVLTGEELRGLQEI